jgi:cytochrome b pre-mRNA-processing protein 3
MIRPPRSFASLLDWRSDPTAKKLYGAIVARARLPVFYQEFSVPDTLAGRYVVLSLHLFAVLHRLKAEGAEAMPLAQELIDRFSADMETVMREIGVGDLSIPKKARGLAAASAALLQDYEKSFAEGEAALATCISRVSPLGTQTAEAASRRLASYLKGVVRSLETQSFADLKAGTLKFPEVSASAEQLGGGRHGQRR